MGANLLKVGSTDPGLAPFAPLFIWVTARWVPKVILGVWIDRRQFARVVGPWILVLNTWLHLIRRDVLLLDWWGVMDTWHLRASTSPRGLVWVPPGPHDVLCVSLSSGLWCMHMIYPFWSPQQASHNGEAQMGIWKCLWWCHIHATNALALSCIIACVFLHVLHQMLETPTLVEIVGIKPYPSVYDHFPFTICRNWQKKVVLISCQHTCTNMVDMVRWSLALE
jgi:hypothetical protein